MDAMFWIFISISTLSMLVNIGAAYHTIINELKKEGVTRESLSPLPMCTMFGIVGPMNGPATIAHEKTHLYTLMPWILTFSMTYSWAFFWADNPWYMAFVYGGITNLSVLWIGETLADLVAMLKYGPVQLFREVAPLYQKMTTTQLICNLPMYPPWRTYMAIKVKTSNTLLKGASDGS